MIKEHQSKVSIEFFITKKYLLNTISKELS